MSMFKWLKSSAQRAAEAEAAIPASFRAAMLSGERRLAELGIGAAHSDVATRSMTDDESRAYHFARDLVRERGPSEASRIADLVVKHVQMLSRTPL